MTGTYNTFEAIPTLPYSIVAYLMDHNEDVFRLLKYDDGNAWRVDATHPNLSKFEKGALVWDGIKRQEDCKIFLTTGISDTWTHQGTQLRISILEANPVNLTIGQVLVGIQVYPHDYVSMLSNYQPRADAILQAIIETINGVTIGKGIGPLFFDASKNSRCRIYTVGSTPYVGRAIIFANWASSS